MTDEAANELAKLLVKLASSGNIKEAADSLRNASSSEKRVSESKLQQRKHVPYINTAINHRPCYEQNPHLTLYHSWYSITMRNSDKKGHPRQNHLQHQVKQTLACREVSTKIFLVAINVILSEVIAIYCYCSSILQSTEELEGLVIRWYLLERYKYQASLTRIHTKKL